VTSRELLTHSGGYYGARFGDMTPHAQCPLSCRCWMAPRPPIVSRFAPRRYRARRRVFGGGFIIAQQVVSDVTGVAFPKLMHDVCCRRMQ